MFNLDILGLLGGSRGAGSYRKVTQELGVLWGDWVSPHTDHLMIVMDWRLVAVWSGTLALGGQ
jgi:hypothetical protein